MVRLKTAAIKGKRIRKKVFQEMKNGDHSRESEWSETEKKGV